MNRSKFVISFFVSLIAFAVKPAFAVDHHKFLDIPYGEHRKQKLDVYFPKFARSAPVIFFVHGVLWRIGDKGTRSQVKNKIEKWVSQGMVVVSINYRMLPDIRPVEQAQDVRKALRFSQQQAGEWGADASQFILMGHSAGAHLVSLVSSTPAVAESMEIEPWLGTVSLDTMAYDVTKIMKGDDVSWFYRNAFGDNPIYWEQASPISQLRTAIPPFLAVCSTSRKLDSCSQSQDFIEKLREFGGQGKLLPVNLSHRKLNVSLGSKSTYTDQVDTFIRQLISSR